MGSNSSIPSEDAEQATPSARGASNLTALRNVSVESTTPSSAQAASASDKETTPGESLQPVNPFEGSQVMEDGSDWLNREVERLAEKELDLEKSENYLRERKLEIKEETQRLSAKEQDMMLRKPKLKLELELKKKEFDREKELLHKRYDSLVAEGIRPPRGGDGGVSWLSWGATIQSASALPISPLQKSEWERERRLQTEEKTKGQQYRFKELQVEELKREDERLRKKERQIEFEEEEVDREVKRLIERNEKVESEEVELGNDQGEIRGSFEKLEWAESYLREMGTVLE